MSGSRKGQPSLHRTLATDQAGLEGNEVMVLVGTDRDAFVATVREPPLPTQRLIAALRATTSKAR
jgi:hypothetical protein